MRLILIHGSLQDASFKKIAQLKKEFDSLSVLEISEVGDGFNFSSPSLFSQKRLVILENPDIKTVEKALEISDQDLTILVQFNKLLEKSSPILKKITERKGEIYNFEESNQTSIFPFLDMLGNLNTKAFSELEKNYNEFGGQYLLTMLAYFLRRMIQISKSSSSFMNQKVALQKKNFSLEKITDLYKQVIETDFNIKQGLIDERLALTLLVKKIISSVNYQ